jgi:hypothetical protein
MNLAANPKQIPINGGASVITAAVYDQNGTPCPNRVVRFSNAETQLGTLSPSFEWTNETGIASVVLTAGAVQGTEKVKAWIGEEISPTLQNTTSVPFTAEDLAPPALTNPSAAPGVILQDNGRARPAGSNLTRINVTVTDDAGVASVTINLSTIGGLPARSMTQLVGTNIWTVTTNATAGINVTSILTIRATDIYGKNNTTAVALEVLRRGDVVRDNVVDPKDMLYIARYTVGYEPEASYPPAPFVADVVGNAGDPRGDGKVDMKDVLYLAKWLAGQEVAP